MPARRTAHLVGSIPLRNAEEVFVEAAASLGSRVRRLPDGETGPRADWIVWQYPVLNACPEFEVGPPGAHPYRALPRLRLRNGAGAGDVALGELGYAMAARASYDVFTRLKRAGTVPAHCRFQVSLPTALAPVAAFVATDDQASVEPVYERRLLEELGEILGAVPHDQLAIQWDTNFEFAMLHGELPSWFSDIRAGVVERLLRLGSHVPDAVELGYHLCHGHERAYLPPGRDVRAHVEIANAVLSGLSRPVNWVHIPLPLHRLAQDDYEPLAALQVRPETDIYLGLIGADEGVADAAARVAYAKRYLKDFGVATACGWGRLPRGLVPDLLDRHAELATPVPPSRTPKFDWPDDFVAIPHDPWVEAPLDGFGLAYDAVALHSWYSNMDTTVSALARDLHDGDILIDYSGGTGILVDRLKLRLFGARVGTVIVDSSPKFLRIARERFRHDATVALRHLRFLPDEHRLQRLDEVLGGELSAGGVDVVATTNAIHLYPDLLDTAGAWAKTLRQGGRLLINSGNIRNPDAGPGDWILDETVWVLGDLCEGIVRTDPAFAEYAPALNDRDRMKEHAEFRDRVFLEPRPLSFYTDTIERAGFRIDNASVRSIEVPVEEWYEFLSAYHDAVAGWVGGTQRIDGREPAPEAVADRLELIRRGLALLFGTRSTFRACWTYLECTKTSH